LQLKRRHRSPIPCALNAQQLLPDKSPSTCLGHHPRPVLPRRIVAHVLGVPALEIGDPMLFFVLMESDDAAWNRW